MNLVTFDIFDTVLTRLVCSPASVFYFVGNSAIKEKLISCTPETFIYARREAERLSRIGHPDGEIDDERIFSFLKSVLGVTENVTDRIRELEIEWETKLLMPVPGASELIMNERKVGKQIAFISDMYWRKDVLVGFLEKHGFWEPGDQLWVSSEHGVSKTTSKLFHKVMEHNKVEKRSKVIHHGNSSEADNIGAISAGLTSNLILKGNPSHYELMLEEFREKTGGLSSLLAGAGRILRANYSENNIKEAGIARIVGDIAGPTFTLFVMWIIRAAKSEGLKRLCFISRDGYVSYLIAKKIIGKIAPEIKVSYIYGSRQAWHIAGLTDFNDFTFEWFLNYMDGATPSSVIQRLGMNWDELLQFAPELKEKIKNPQESVKPIDMEILKSTFLANSELRERVYEVASKKRELLLEYITQEGFSENEKTGMVEIGWSGRTRNSFERAIGKGQSKNLHWFYFGINNCAQLHDPHRVHTFMFGPKLKFPDINNGVIIAESFCFAPHPSVLGYLKKDGKIIPEFKEGIEASLDNWGRGFYLSCIDEYCDYLPLELIGDSTGIDLRSPAFKLLNEFTNNPTKEDALIWGSIPFEHDQFGKVSFKLSPEAHLNLTSIKRALQFGTFAKAVSGNNIGVWEEGAWASRGRTFFPLYPFVFLGYLRVNGRQELKRILSETKSYFKIIFKVK